MRSFCLFVSRKLLFSSERSGNVEKSFLIISLKYLFPAQKNLVLLQQVFESNSELVPSRLEISNKSILEFQLMNYWGPSNILSIGKCDNCNINYSGKSAKIVQNSNSDSRSTRGLLD